ncbi:hypothetical protein LEN26_017534 [Aphanomyces euteiches]|nr:hypothetical protein LEN26_017534 [Aphanomyces euteiches]KAH9119088.1 hypothetical protein AeMF1_008064 [Aphanomyces euteiches]KAH9167324.1 hypothetical protein AeNC1_018169 [Aphanomyces euteiches]
MIEFIFQFPSTTSSWPPTTSTLDKLPLNLALTSRHSFTAKPFDEEYDVEVKVTHCGICGSDLHTVTGGWGAIKYPMVVGHEIIGHVVRVGSKVDPAKYV